MSSHLHLHLLLLLTLFTFLTHHPSHSLTHQSLLLHSAKLLFHDPHSSLHSWDPLSDTPCSWAHITCDPITNSVTSVDLSSLNLSGPFPVSLCGLESLSFLSLYDNFVNGSLPSDLSTCRNLRHLDVAQNLLTGVLPESLAALPELVYLDLSGNNFSGEVPVTFGSFPRLEVVSFVSNLLDGGFPSFLGNVSTLRVLNLTDNPFRPSRLGPELGGLASLEVFWAGRCNLFGEIPESLSRLGNLTVLDLSENSLNGSFPSWITELTRLTQLELYTNSLTGELPREGWGRLESLRYFDLSMNELTGTIPTELTQLPLASLNLYENSLEGEIPESIADSPNLYELKLFSNRLTGELPSRLGENSPLYLIDVSTNNLTGEIPPNLCANGKLEELLMLHNSLSGQIPTRLSECRTLTRVRLTNNRLSGNVPLGMWGLPHLQLLEVTNNSLNGSIPKSIASATNLSQLVISNNHFQGEIPEELGFLGSLVSFLGGNNHFSGSLPSSVVNMVQLGRLDLHNNVLSGEIPSGINSLKKLNDLNLANNQLSGHIPAEIGSLSTLNYLDLSGNQLTGPVPSELQNLKLNQLNLSNNRLTGKLPSFFASGMYKTSFLGNPGLCGDISGLCRSDVNARKSQLWVLRLIFALAAFVFVMGVVWFYWKYKNFKQTNHAIDRSKWTLMSFHKLGFNEYEILDCLDEDNVIGTGASGKVYKAVLSNGEAVAVKKLWSSSNKLVNNNDLENVVVQDDGFDAEVETLGKIRHKNIVRLWCCCKTKECKLLVYEYMPNGSLGDLLHSPKGGLLDWPMRYRIALDSAEGLSYLHHDCVPPIVHRDIKSNNILLDGDFGAKVSDFGVAKVVEVTGKGTKSMSIIAGSCGYIAPEYGYTLRVNERSDTYSFGVVILELVTGKRPVDPEYGEKDLVKWVCTTMDQKGVDHIIDPKLDTCFKAEICKALNIGLLCTSPLPINRPSMRRVVKMLQEISGENMSKSGKKDGKLTPYYYEDASDQGSVA